MYHNGYIMLHFEHVPQNYLYSNEADYLYKIIQNHEISK